jgi:hypothetical protein
MGGTVALSSRNYTRWIDRFAVPHHDTRGDVRSCCFDPTTTTTMAAAVVSERSKDETTGKEVRASVRKEDLNDRRRYPPVERVHTIRQGMGKRCDRSSSLYAPMRSLDEDERQDR